MSVRPVFLGIAVALAVAACSGNSVGTIPPQTSQPAPPLARGSVISMSYVTTFTKKQMNGDLGLEGQVITEIGGAPVCTAKLYVIVYQTIGAKGEPATASEGFFVPGGGCKPPFTLVGYGQGTNTVRAQKITNPTPQNVEPVSLASIFAAHGYAVAATDYLGLGYSNYPYQPYLNANAEASAIVDAMRAARHAARTLRVPLGDKVFLTGYSQGGHSILGTQKVVESENASEFHLIGDSPGSGLYALTQTMLDLLARPAAPQKGGAVLWAYVMPGYQKAYGNVYGRPTDMFRNPYAATIDTLLPVNTYAEAAELNGTTLPRTGRELLQPAFQTEFPSDPHIGARVDLAVNDLLNGWKPKAPVYLCAGSRDPVVEYKNSLLAYRFFSSEGVKVNLIDFNPLVPASVPRSQYHDAGFVLCHVLERVDVLDNMTHPAHAGILHPTLHGTIGPIESAALP
jgi:pimeloyl-ACP methyl ester carboxylesterase